MIKYKQTVPIGAIHSLLRLHEAITCFTHYKIESVHLKQPYKQFVFTNDTEVFLVTVEPNILLLIGKSRNISKYTAQMRFCLA